MVVCFFFFKDPSSTENYTYLHTLSLHDALPISRDPEWQEEGAEVVHNVEQAIALANAPHISVIGGAEICALFLSRADRIELTQVHATPPGDTFLDAFDPTAWQETAREDFPAEGGRRSEEHTSELQSLMRISYAVFCLKQKHKYQ